ncbi:MAG: hypothetical protein ABIH34_04555 [Nanoarchaeota archaeon]
MSLTEYLTAIEKVLKEKPRDYINILRHESGIYDNYHIMVGMDVEESEELLRSLPGFRMMEDWQALGSSWCSPSGFYVNVWEEHKIYADNEAQRSFLAQFPSTYILHGMIADLELRGNFPDELHFIEGIALAALDIGNMLHERKIPCYFWGYGEEENPYGRGFSDFLK